MENGVIVNMDKNKGIIVKRKAENNRILYDVMLSFSGDIHDRIFINAEAFFNEEIMELRDEVNLIWKGDMLFVTKFEIKKEEADLKNVRGFRGK